jgi:hypothetical protein
VSPCAHGCAALGLLAVFISSLLVIIGVVAVLGALTDWALS